MGGPVLVRIEQHLTARGEARVGATLKGGVDGDSRFGESHLLPPAYCPPEHRHGFVLAEVSGHGGRGGGGLFARPRGVKHAFCGFGAGDVLGGGEDGARDQRSVIGQRENPCTLTPHTLHPPASRGSVRTWCRTAARMRRMGRAKRRPPPPRPRWRRRPRSWRCRPAASPRPRCRGRTRRKSPWSSNRCRLRGEGRGVWRYH